MKKNPLTLIFLLAALAAGAYAYTQKSRADELDKKIAETEKAIQQLKAEKELLLQQQEKSAILQMMMQETSKPKVIK